MSADICLLDSAVAGTSARMIASKARISSKDVLLLAVRRGKWIVFFSLVQVLCFPWGLLGFLALPGYIFGFLHQTGDRESVVDMPFIQINAGAVWLLVAGLIVWRVWRVGKRQARAVRESQAGQKRGESSGNNP